MNLGKILAYLYDAAFFFFVISVLVLPVLVARWRAREKADAAETERVLDALHQDTTRQFEQDAI